jgi:hypothetical protein
MNVRACVCVCVCALVSVCVFAGGLRSLRVCVCSSVRTYINRVGQIRRIFEVRYIRRIIPGGGRGRIRIPYFPYQKWIGIIRRVYAIFRMYIPYFGKKIRSKPYFRWYTPESGRNPSNNSPFCSFGLIVFVATL